MSTDLSDGMKATTVNGEEVTVQGKANDAEVVLADVKQIMELYMYKVIMSA
jgi:hypothetical protein